MSAASQRDGAGGRWRYLAVGHVTIDILPGGERRPGGTVLYSALQAARLGLDARIVTRGAPAEIEALLEPFARELAVSIQPAAETTTFATEGSGKERRQRVLAWAGPIAVAALPAAEILHLAPVAAELAGEAPGAWCFVGMTPQGFARCWRGVGGEIEGCEADPAHVGMAGRCDAIVLSQSERADCSSLIDRGIGAGAAVAVTAGPGATELLVAGEAREEMSFEPIAAPADDLGAGDVYAAAFFTRLAAGEDAARAARFAHAAAELRMQGAGAGAIAAAARIEARVSRLAPRRL
jgi:sugar/nucleoside kinase (ribokinase family)